MYAKILKELKKGNAVLLEVLHIYGNTKFRIVTPKDCEYVVGLSYFEQSCFVPYRVYSSVQLINCMKAYDKKWTRKILKMQVL